MRRALILFSAITLTTAGFMVSACTMKKQEAPPLTGPSEFGTAITVQIRPDVLTQDGVARAEVMITVRQANGQPPQPPLDLRVETRVDGVPVDFGTLSQRTVTTRSDGTAIVTYTAPPPSLSGTEQIVDIAVTPIGGNFDNAVARSATLRLVPQGVVNPPAGLVPAFTSSPPAPVEDTTVFFDASASRANTAIASYSWNFGNGRTGSGVTATTTFDEPGNYFVTLTIRDEFGRSASTTNTVTVDAGAVPTAQFDFSPSDPRVGEQVNFNAARSTPTPGRTIVSYQWDFGDGTFETGRTTDHTYRVARTYTVVLTVTDDAGRSASIAGTVSVRAN